MTLLQAIVYGVVQGLGEFLPISSSAHLVLVPWFFGWTDPGLTFDVALHVGTLVAVVAYFWRDWLRLIVKGFTEATGSDGRLFWYLVVATIPGAVAGFLLEKKAETIFRAPLLIAAMLVIMGLLLYAADRWGSKRKDVKRVTLREPLDRHLPDGCHRSGRLALGRYHDSRVSPASPVKALPGSRFSFLRPSSSGRPSRNCRTFFRLRRS